MDSLMTAVVGADNTALDTEQVGPLRVSVFGLGYVGAVTTACIADAGFPVVAVDVDAARVQMIAEGRAPIVEPMLPELLKKNVDAGRLVATTDVMQALADTDLSIVCVGTPSRPNGDTDLSYVIAVSEQIGEAIKKKDAFHSVVVRSTMPPGSMKTIVIPALEKASGKVAGVGFGVAYFPEFLRESTAIEDYENQAVIVVGKVDDITINRLRTLNARIPAPEKLVDLSSAEAIKYANNCWHAVKITFANEIGNIARAAGIDGEEVMSALCLDNRLNISMAYMKPGMAFGGSCLPKDLRALRYRGRLLDVTTPLLDATAVANDQQIERAFELVRQTGGRRIAMLGLSFKAGTDDLRESPNVEIAEKLFGKGYDLKIFDRNVSAAIASGTSPLAKRQPHLAGLLQDDIAATVADADVVVIANKDPEFAAAVAALPEATQVVDLVRIDMGMTSDGKRYHGLCW